jgi:hypothetical protein
MAIGDLERGVVDDWGDLRGPGKIGDPGWMPTYTPAPPDVPEDQLDKEATQSLRDRSPPIMNLNAYRDVNGGLYFAATPRVRPSIGSEGPLGTYPVLEDGEWVPAPPLPIDPVDPPNGDDPVLPPEGETPEEREARLDIEREEEEAELREEEERLEQRDELNSEFRAFMDSLSKEELEMLGEEKVKRYEAKRETALGKGVDLYMEYSPYAILANIGKDIVESFLDVNLTINPDPRKITKADYERWAGRFQGKLEGMGRREYREYLLDLDRQAQEKTQRLRDEGDDGNIIDDFYGGLKKVFGVDDPEGDEGVDTGPGEAVPGPRTVDPAPTVVDSSGPEVAPTQADFEEKAELEMEYPVPVLEEGELTAYEQSIEDEWEDEMGFAKGGIVRKGYQDGGLVERPMDPYEDANGPKPLSEILYETLIAPLYAVPIAPPPSQLAPPQQEELAPERLVDRDVVPLPPEPVDPEEAYDTRWGLAKGGVVRKGYQDGGFVESIAPSPKQLYIDPETGYPIPPSPKQLYIDPETGYPIPPSPKQYTSTGLEIPPPLAPPRLASPPPEPLVDPLSAEEQVRQEEIRQEIEEEGGKYPPPPEFQEPDDDEDPDPIKQEPPEMLVDRTDDVVPPTPEPDEEISTEFERSIRQEEEEEEGYYAKGGVVRKGYEGGGLVERKQLEEPAPINEEVADDLLRNLSEGEFVIPVHVVKYFGEKYFAELINSVPQP